MKIENPALWKEFQSAGRCEWCNVHCKRREPHHLRSRTPEITIRINVFSVGSSRLASCFCHYKIHLGKITRAEILARVAVREQTTPELITDVMDLFQRLVKPTPLQLERALFELGPHGYFLAQKELKEAGILPGF